MAPARSVLERGDVGASGFVLKSDGAQAHLLYARGPGLGAGHDDGRGGLLRRHEGPRGLQIRRARHGGRDAQVGRRAGLAVDDITWVVPHQANQRILDAYAKALGLPNKRIVSNLASYGNTSSATIPIAMCEAWEDGRHQARRQSSPHGDRRRADVGRVHRALDRPRV